MQTPRQFLISTAAELMRRYECSDWQALNYAADSFKSCEAGTLGAAALAVFYHETTNDQQYDKLCRAVKQAK